MFFKSVYYAQCVFNKMHESVNYLLQKCVFYVFLLKRFLFSVYLGNEFNDRNIEGNVQGGLFFASFFIIPMT